MPSRTTRRCCPTCPGEPGGHCELVPGVDDPPGGRGVVGVHGGRHEHVPELPEQHGDPPGGA